MTKLSLIILFFFLGFQVFSQTNILAPAGWVYYGGDEFDSTAVDSKKWLVFGTNGTNATYGQPQGMVQTYRPQQVTMQTLSTGEKVLRIFSERRKDGVMTNGYPGWWSGAIASREAGAFYPLYSRMDIRAKVANQLGFWHALWARYRTGASIAELDLNECFVNNNGYDVVNHAIHLWNSSTNRLDVNVMGSVNRTAKVPDMDNTFHIYSLIVEPDSTATNEAIITFMVDEKVSYFFATKTKPYHNRFITEPKNNGWLNTTWDMAITGQIGGQWVGYPPESLDSLTTELDYFRLFVRPTKTKVDNTHKVDFKVTYGKGKMSILMDPEMERAEIINKLGQIIKTSTDKEFSVSLPSDVYIIRVKTKDGRMGVLKKFL